MTTYVYTVRSNKPLGLAVGLGNMPVIGASSYSIPELGRTQHARSSGAAASDGHEASMQLVAIEDPPEPTPAPPALVEALLRMHQIDSLHPTECIGCGEQWPCRTMNLLSESAAAVMQEKMRRG